MWRRFGPKRGKKPPSCRHLQGPIPDFPSARCATMSLRGRPMEVAMSRAKRMTSRVHIDEAIVEQALYLASIAKDSKEVHDYADTEHRYLVLRLRGSRVGWFVRAKRRMKRI